MPITSEQVHAARALLRWEQQQLADASGVSLPSIKRLETQAGPLAAAEPTSQAIRQALEEAGVEFSSDGQPGVRLRRSGKRADDHPRPVGPATDAVGAMDAAIAKDRSRRKG